MCGCKHQGHAFTYLPGIRIYIHAHAYTTYRYTHRLNTCTHPCRYIHAQIRARTHQTQKHKETTTHANTRTHTHTGTGTHIPAVIHHTISHTSAHTQSLSLSLSLSLSHAHTHTHTHTCTCVSRNNEGTHNLMHECTHAYACA